MSLPEYLSKYLQNLINEFNQNEPLVLSVVGVLVVVLVGYIVIIALTLPNPEETPHPKKSDKSNPNTPQIQTDAEYSEHSASAFQEKSESESLDKKSRKKVASKLDTPVRRSTRPHTPTNRLKF